MNSLNYLIFVSIIMACSTANAQGLIQSTHFKNLSTENTDDNSEGPPKDTTTTWGTVTSASIYGGGSLFNLASGNDANAVNETNSAPMGSLGISLNSERFQMDFYVSKAGTQNLEVTTAESLGAILMNPNVGGDGISVGLYGKLSEQKRAGVHVDFRSQNASWELDSVTTVSASPLRLRLGLYYRPWDFGKSDQDLNFELQAHYTLRSIKGNFPLEERTIADLKIKDELFEGVDLSAAFRINGFEIFAQYSVNSKSILMPGFSGSQFTYGINVSGVMIDLIKNGNTQASDN